MIKIDNKLLVSYGAADEKIGRCMSIRYQSVTYHGPQTQVSIMPTWAEVGKATILGVFAYKVINDEIQYDEYIDISDKLQRDAGVHNLGIWKPLRWNVPEGLWKIVFIVADRKDNYIDPMNPDAVQAYIERVYESTATNMKEYFNNPVLGFFFDEPGYFIPEGRVPWTDNFCDIFKAQKGYDPLPFVVKLWLEPMPYYSRG